MKSTSLHKGDEVEWETSQGKTHGKIVRKLTAPRMIKGHKKVGLKGDDGGDSVGHRSGRRYPRNTLMNWGCDPLGRKRSEKH